MNVKRKIYLINDYKDGVHSASAKEIKNGLSLRGIYVQSAHGGHYYGGMVWGGDLKSSDILILLHSQISSNSGEIQSIVKWAKDNKKPLIIVTLDDTPLTGAWELILTGYKKYWVIDYNYDNLNNTIFEIENAIEHIENDFFTRPIIHYSIFIFAGLIALLAAVCDEESYSIGRKIFISIYVAGLIIATGYAILGIYWGITSIVSQLYRKFTENNNGKQEKILKIEDKDKTQSTLTDNDKIEYKCFIAGATTITEERDAVRASLSQVVNRWGSLDIILSSYTFEDFDNNHQQQMRYYKFIQNEADCVIVIITDGIGPQTIGEYRLAVSTLQKTKKRPKVVVYADEKSKNDPDVVEFKKEVENNKTYWVSYTSLNELKEKIQNEMTKQLLPIVQEIIKKS